ncbi:hypothetical protein [Primorskyibacter sp. S87]
MPRKPEPDQIRAALIAKLSLMVGRSLRPEELEKVDKILPEAVKAVRDVR